MKLIIILNRFYVNNCLWSVFFSISRNLVIISFETQNRYFKYFQEKC